jgi:hypothetical protein
MVIFKDVIDEHRSKNRNNSRQRGSKRWSSGCFRPSHAVQPNNRVKAVRQLDSTCMVQPHVCSTYLERRCKMPHTILTGTRVSSQSRTTQWTTLTGIVLDLGSGPSLYSCLCSWLHSRNRRTFKSEALQSQGPDKQCSYPTFLALSTNFMHTSAIFVQPWVSWATGHVAHHLEMSCQISSSSIRRMAHDRASVRSE